MAGADAVLDGLRKVCEDGARPAVDSDAVAGVPARYVAAPASTQEVSEVLRLAAEHELAVVARGGGTKLGWGNPPAAADLVLDTGRLTGVVEHAAGDLVAVARAGTPVADLQAVLAGAGQQLALDVAFPGATLGGTVATATSGPRRLGYGTPRDLLIGVTFVRADGVVAKAGGRVVKNVAGYDFGKLLTGSYGTLGVLTEVIFRLHPLPAAQRFVTVSAPGPAAAGRVAAAVLHAQVVPAAVEVDAPPGGPVSVAVLLEGVEAGVAGRAAATVRLLGPDSAEADPPAWFGGYPFTAGDVGLKLTCTLTGVAPLLAAADEAGRAHGVPVAVRGSASGVLYAGLPGASAPRAVVDVVAALRTAAAAYAGNVVVLTAPPAVREHLDLWGPVPGLGLMRRLKHELDPGHRLAPGRFVGGI
jgi:glycolate oxidase FAD binding subunit